MEMTKKRGDLPLLVLFGRSQTARDVVGKIMTGPELASIWFVLMYRYLDTRSADAVLRVAALAGRVADVVAEGGDGAPALLEQGVAAVLHLALHIGARAPGAPVALARVVAAGAATV